MQGESRLEKEADASSSKTVPNHIGVPIFKGLKSICVEPLKLEPRLKCFPGFSQLPKHAEFIYPLAHIVFWARISNDMHSKSVLQYVGVLLKTDI